MSGRVKISASVLAADFAALGESVRAAEAAGCDSLHLDVMDGHFVPNLSFGPPVIAALRKLTELPFDVHLMVERPEELLPDYVKAGADYVTVHVEACRHLHRTLTQIRELGARPGVALNPATPVSLIGEVWEQVDLVLVMSVNPGFGGQAFIPHSLEKIRRCQEQSIAADHYPILSVDGGVSVETIASVVAAGATNLVVGSGLFGYPAGLAAAVRDLHTGADAGRARYA